jgi:hypothetical protein
MMEALAWLEKARDAATADEPAMVVGGLVNQAFRALSPAP